MVRIALLFGLILIGLGVGLWMGTGRTQVTALIPAFFGLAFVLCGLWGRSEKWRKHAMHVTALLALLGIGGTAKGLIGAVKHLAGTPAERPTATFGQAAMCLLCVVYLVMAICSFRAARKARSS